MVKLSFHLAFVFIFASFSLLQADLPYMPVTFKLQTGKTHYQVGERIDFRLKVYNSDKNRSYPIVLPGTQNKGQKLIQLRFYSVNEKTNFYTCAGKENPEIRMSCEKPGNATVRQLAPGDSLDIVFFLNDRKNYLHQTASHHELDQPLVPGNYQVHIFYDPSVTEFKDLYHYIWSTNDSTSSEKLNFWTGGNVCQYIPLTISKSTANQKPEALTPTCAKNCTFCKAIDEGNWSAVKKTMEKHIQKSADFTLALAQTHWMKTHRNVVWVSPPPQEVQSSLPSYFSYEIVFLSHGEVFYYTAGYQWGIVYQSRSRFNQVFRSSRPNPLFPGEDLSYIGLVYFTENSCSTPGTKHQ
ncbi:MAG: hypothetical protein JNK73_08025 [Bacteroidia bacterium]|nr:hypothetical protein [Bacteroidia bacterium]